MRTDEPARLELLRGLERVLGPERATTLMTYLPHTVDLATRDDLRALERRMEARFEALEARFEARFEALEARFEALEARFEALRGVLGERHTSLEHQISAGNDSTASMLRGEMNRLITSQTRAIVFALVGAITANASLVLLAT